MQAILRTLTGVVYDHCDVRWGRIGRQSYLGSGLSDIQDSEQIGAGESRDGHRSWKKT